MAEEQKRARKSSAPASRRTQGRRSSPKRAAKARPQRRREVPLTVFIHIPKTAGTTLTGVLRSNFPSGTVRVLGNVFHGVGQGVNRGPVERLRRSGHVLTRDIHLLGGHIPFGVHTFLPDDSRYITFLRDPVERTLSHYYRLLSMHRSKPIPRLPAEPSLEQMLEARDYLYDNLQTRMLSGEPEPFGDVTDEMLERAKENLSTSFAAFGLTDRFDESLVLLKRALGLRSILYVSQRMTTARPRTDESKAELVPIAERFNAYDLELYRWAAERFEKTVARQDPDFLVDLAALQSGVSDGANVAPPPAAATLSRQRLWEELVAARAELLSWEYDYAKTDEKDPLEVVDEVRSLVEDVAGRLGGLESRIAAAPLDTQPAGEAEADGGAVEEPAASRQRPQGRERAAQLAAQRERKEAHLEDLRGQIEELEEAVGVATANGDPHVVRELERLRGLAAEAEEELRQHDERLLEAARAPLTKKRDAVAGLLERSERRLEGIREQLRKLETPADDEQPAKHPSPRRQARIERVRALLAEKEAEVAQQREAISEVERELSELEQEKVDDAEDARATAPAPADEVTAAS